jgi:molybdate transport system substrate-binding protein
MNTNFVRIGAAFLLIFSLASPAARAVDVDVSAAASLGDALREIGAAYEKTSGDHLVMNFAASSVLARQIEEGAPADLIFSADEAKLDDLEKKGLLAAGTRKSLLSNQLVIIVPSDSALGIASAKDLTGPAVKRIALGEPSSVPAGIYARTYLQKLGLWQAIAPKVVPEENVRAALAAVESGNVEAGIVYKTDELIAKGVKLAMEVPVKDGPAISYPVAILSESRQPAAAKKLEDYLESPAAKAVFRKYGFIVKP